MVKTLFSFAMDKGKEKEKEYVKMAPSVSSLRADQAAKGAPKPKTPSRAPARAAKPKPISKAAMDYAMSHLPQTASEAEKNARLSAQKWETVCAYRRQYRNLQPPLVMDESLGPGAHPHALDAEIRSYQQQKGDSKAVEKAQAMYVAGLGLIEKLAGRFPVGGRLQGRLARTGARKVFLEGLAIDELTEITILYPWLFRQGPELNLLMITWQLIQSCLYEVDAMPGPSGSEREVNPDGEGNAWHDL